MKCGASREPVLALQRYRKLPGKFEDGLGMQASLWVDWLGHYRCIQSGLEGKSEAAHLL